jgi:hypothetical protein
LFGDVPIESLDNDELDLLGETPLDLLHSTAKAIGQQREFRKNGPSFYGRAASRPSNYDSIMGWFRLFFQISFYEIKIIPLSNHFSLLFSKMSKSLFLKFSFSVQNDAESAKENISQHFNKMATELPAFKKFKIGETTDPSKEASAAGVVAK